MVNFCSRKIARKFDSVRGVVQKAKKFLFSNKGQKGTPFLGSVPVQPSLKYTPHLGLILVHLGLLPTLIIVTHKFLACVACQGHFVLTAVLSEHNPRQ